MWFLIFHDFALFKGWRLQISRKAGVKLFNFLWVVSQLFSSDMFSLTFFMERSLIVLSFDWFMQEIRRFLPAIAGRYYYKGVFVVQSASRVTRNGLENKAVLPMEEVKIKYGSKFCKNITIFQFGNYFELWLIV